MRHPRQVAQRDVVGWLCARSQQVQHAGRSACHASLLLLLSYTGLCPGTLLVALVRAIGFAAVCQAGGLEPDGGVGAAGESHGMQQQQ
eukprot:1150935-Pelagomonas_calceolata.AAC.7